MSVAWSPAGRARTTRMNPPYLDYYKDVVGGGARAGAFIAAQHLFVNNIRGRRHRRHRPLNLGHFHSAMTSSGS